MNMNFIESSSGAELSDRSNLDAATPGHGDLRSHLDAVVQVPGLDQHEPAELFFRLGERTIGSGQLAAPDPDGGLRLDRLQRVSDDEVSRLPEGVVVGQA